jgi:hypothetical protein
MAGTSRQRRPPPPPPHTIPSIFSHAVHSRVQLQQRCSYRVCADGGANALFDACGRQVSCALREGAGLDWAGLDPRCLQSHIMLLHGGGMHLNGLAEFFTCSQLFSALPSAYSFCRLASLAILTGSILYPPYCIFHTASSILHPPSSILYPLLYIFFATSSSLLCNALLLLILNVNPPFTGFTSIRSDVRAFYESNGVDLRHIR